jgi:hypothetical protein
LINLPNMAFSNSRFAHYWAGVDFEYADYPIIKFQLYENNINLIFYGPAYGYILVQQQHQQ